MRISDRRYVILLGTLFLLVMQISALCAEIDMKPHWNDAIALANPHKGWYHHFPDNHINKYIIRDDSHLLDFPGMDHLYIRLAWAYLEPQEGRFDWEVIDSIINKWRAKGLKIAFRISCKETGTDRVEQQFATPKWVMEAGAKGDYYRSGEKVGPDGPWEPVFDDPAFLEKLESFLRAFAARYDGKPWIRYIDIGSIGDWGEGHTHSGSRLEYGFEARKVHIDLHLRYFRKTQLTITDDYVYSVSDLKDRDRLHKYVVSNGMSYRDDSPLVDWYVRTYPETYTLRSPEMFEATWRTVPNVFELEHYSGVKRNGNWLGKPGSSLAEYGKGRSGADMFRGAMTLIRPTYIGYHGDAHEWLSENPELTKELLNRCGYWYFLHRVQIPDEILCGQTLKLNMHWENRGVAPAYNPYRLKLRLDGPQSHEIDLDAGNTKWMPKPDGGVYSCNYPMSMPRILGPGRYTLKFQLYSGQEDRNVLVALDPGLLDDENYYTIGQVDVKK